MGSSSKKVAWEGHSNVIHLVCTPFYSRQMVRRGRRNRNYPPWIFPPWLTVSKNEIIFRFPSARFHSQPRPTALCALPSAGCCCHAHPAVAVVNCHLPLASPKTATTLCMSLHLIPCFASPSFPKACKVRPCPGLNHAYPPPPFPRFAEVFLSENVIFYCSC